MCVCMCVYVHMCMYVYMFEYIFLFLWCLERLHVSDNHSFTELLPQSIMIVSCSHFSYLQSKIFEWIFPNASLSVYGYK